jgi:hypothetical protein
MHQVLVGGAQRVGGLAILYHLYVFILVYFYNTHQVLVGPPSRGWWPCYFIYLLFILFHVYNTNQVLVRLPQGVGGLPILFLLFYLFYY